METPQQTEVTPEPRGWRAALRRPAVRVGLVALAVIVAQWMDTRMQMASLQQELARRLAAIAGLLDGIDEEKRSAVLDEIFSRVQEAKRVADLEDLVTAMTKKLA